MWISLVAFVLQVAAVPPEPGPSTTAVPAAASLHDAGDEVISLRDERTRLESQRLALTDELRATQKSIQDRAAFDNALSQYQAALATKDKQRIAYYASQLHLYESLGAWSDENMVDKLRKHIVELQRDIRAVDQSLRNNDIRLNRLTNVEQQRQDFKNRISRIFGWLIGGLIVLFFIVVILDRNVRVAVFSGPSGLQMITLFSIVIAVILFGITGILEGRELAAILGSLSGYILGRVTDREGHANQ